MQQELAAMTAPPFTWLDLNDPSPDELNQVAEQYDLYYTHTKIRGLIERIYYTSSNSSDHLDF